MSTYGEPWVYEEHKYQDDHIYSVEMYGQVMALAYEPTRAARIVACVNACAGMDDPVAEIARLKETAWMYGQLKH